MRATGRGAFCGYRFTLFAAAAILFVGAADGRAAAVCGGLQTSLANRQVDLSGKATTSDACPEFDTNGSGMVEIDAIVGAVAATLGDAPE